MESRCRIKSFKERRLEQQFDELAEKIKALPADRIQVLEKMLTATTTAERQARFRQRQRLLDRTRPPWWIDRRIVTEVKRLVDDRGGDRQDALNAILAEWLEKNAP